jgi:molybdopterin converting factor subunit 1
MNAGTTRRNVFGDPSKFDSRRPPTMPVSLFLIGPSLLLEYSSLRVMSKTNTITIHVLFFASAREAAQSSSATIAVDSTCTSQEFRTILADRYPALAPLVLDEESITLALNEEYLVPGQVIELKDGDTIALIPPISGG